jgi:hypothetical protein
MRQILPSTSAPHNVSILLFKTNIETIFFNRSTVVDFV